MPTYNLFCLSLPSLQGGLERRQTEPDQMALAASPQCPHGHPGDAANQIKGSISSLVITNSYSVCVLSW